MQQALQQSKTIDADPEDDDDNDDVPDVIAARPPRLHLASKFKCEDDVEKDVADRLALFRYLAILKIQKPNLAKEILEQKGA